MYGVKKDWVEQNPDLAAAKLTRMRELLCQELNNIHKGIMFLASHRQTSSMSLNDEGMTSEDIEERVSSLAGLYFNMAMECTMPLHQEQEREVDLVERSSVHRAMGFVYGRMCLAYNKGEDIRELEVPAIVEEYRRTLHDDYGDAGDDEAGD